MTAFPSVRSRRSLIVSVFAVEDLQPGAVYRMARRDYGLSTLAVYTGQTTRLGRCRFEVVDRKLGESLRFSCRVDAVLGKVADSLEEWCRRKERQGGAA